MVQMRNKKEENFVVKLMDILVEQNVINQSEASAIVRSFYDSNVYEFDAFLIDEGLVTVAAMLAALATYYSLESFDVVGYFFESNLLHKFPKELMLRYGFIPLEEEGNIMVVVAADPFDTELLPEMGKYVSHEIQFKVGLYQDIIEAVKEFYDTAVTDEGEHDMYDSSESHVVDESELEDLQDLLQENTDSDDTEDFS